ASVERTREPRHEAGVLDAIAEALTIQIERDFAPAWNVKPRRVTVGGRGDKLHLFDTSHQDDDHRWDIVDDHGDPYAHVFAGVHLEHGSTWVDGAEAISV